jgi:hypothetical protein
MRSLGTAIARAGADTDPQKGSHMRTLHLTATVLALALAVTVLATLPATAVASSVPLTSVDVLLLVPQDPAGSSLIVSGVLPSTAPLPATVSLALPTGLQVAWAGEILGGDPSADPAVKYTTRTVGSWDVHDLTLTKARIGQIEAAYPAGVTSSGGVTTAKLDWTAPEAAKSVTLTIRIPAGATVQSQTGGLVAGQGSTSEVPYAVTLSNVKQGQALSATLVYKAAPASAASAPATTSAAAPVNPAPTTGGTTPPGSPSTSPSPFIIALVLLFLVSWTLYALMEVRKRETANAARNAAPASGTSKSRGAKTTKAKASGSSRAKSTTGDPQTADDEDE